MGERIRKVFSEVNLLIHDDSFGFYVMITLGTLIFIGLLIAGIYNQAHSEYTGTVIRRLIVRHYYVPADPGEMVCLPVAKPGGGISINCERRGDHPEEFWLILEDGDRIKVSGFNNCPIQTYYAEHEFCGPLYCWWEHGCEGLE